MNEREKVDFVIRLLEKEYSRDEIASNLYQVYGMSPSDAQKFVLPIQTEYVRAKVAHTRWSTIVLSIVSIVVGSIGTIYAVIYFYNELSALKTADNILMIGLVLVNLALRGYLRLVILGGGILMFLSGFAEIWRTLKGVFRGM